MSLGGILLLVVAVISLFVFIYLIVVTARNWGILHTIMLCFLFLECWSFLVFSAGVMEHRLKWLKEVAANSKKADDAEKETQRLLWGDESATSESNESLVPVKSELRRLTFDRGRVWRNASLIDQPNGQLRFQLSTNAPAPAADGLEGGAAPAAPAAPAPSSNVSLPVAMVVYGFSQVEDDKGRPIPDRYLGEYTVVESNAGQVLLKPTKPLEANQLKWIQAGEATAWTFYELLPLDAHETYAAEGSKSTEDAIFGRMDKDTIEKLLEAIPDTDGRRERVVNSYLRDGQASVDDDPPRSVWLRVELNKDYQFDVDSKEDANATVGGYFDMSGRSVDVRMKRDDGQPVSLKAGTQLVITQDAAQKLIDDGTAKLIQRVYVRPLNAYERAFSHLHLRLDEVDKRTVVYQRETNLLQEANQIGQAMISERQVENQKLTADLGQYNRELEFITEQVKSMDTEYAQTKAKVVELYQSLHKAHEQLVKAKLQ